jgi:hypothetical protein
MMREMSEFATIEALIPDHGATRENKSYLIYAQVSVH